MKPSAPHNAIRMVPLAEITAKKSTQARADIDSSTVENYAEAMERGEDLPPILLVQDGDRLWLADGFHRYHACRTLSRTEIRAEVTQGNHLDAVLLAVASNATHGLPRTTADKHRCVRMVLHTAEWEDRSDRWIAEKCQLSDHTVAKVRQKMEEENAHAVALWLIDHPDGELCECARYLEISTKAVSRVWINPTQTLHDEGREVAERARARIRVVGPPVKAAMPPLDAVVPSTPTSKQTTPNVNTSPVEATSYADCARAQLRVSRNGSLRKVKPKKTVAQHMEARKKEKLESTEYVHRYWSTGKAAPPTPHEARYALERLRIGRRWNKQQHRELDILNRFVRAAEKAAAQSDGPSGEGGTP